MDKKNTLEILRTTSYWFAFFNYILFFVAIFIGLTGVSGAFLIGIVMGLFCYITFDRIIRD